MALYGNPQLSGREKVFHDDEIIVSKTDLTGKLIYGNRTFYRMAAMNEKQTLGQQHNIIRHPEMPRTVFELLWNTIKDGKEIFAYVNNRSANGDNYWVFAHVTPSFDASGNITGYHSNRRNPKRQVIDSHIAPLYRDLLKIEQSGSSPKQGLQDAYDKVLSILSGAKMNFNEFMFSLGV
ncbi:MAG: PAS domain-containing protein [Rhodospirillaceae bacterium]|nr:PAS domain-containing protein [Rhodospirillaceae bacterium]